MAMRAAVTGMLLAAFVTVPGALAQDVPGVPLNEPTSLGEDIGFGKQYKPSLSTNFQDWGAMVVSTADGFPTRLGEKSIRFETREGFCGVDPGEWSDCENGRSRHELSTGGDFDAWNTDSWYTLSLFVPASFDEPANIKTTVFQFWSGGFSGWQFKYEKDYGFFLQREFDHARTLIVPSEAAVDRWIDVTLRINHSRDEDGSLTVWADGMPAYDYAGVTGGKNAKLRPYFKFGIYNTAMGEDGAPINGGGFANGEGLPNLHVFFDEVRHAKTCDGLQLGDLGYDCAALLDAAVVDAPDGLLPAQHDLEVRAHELEILDDGTVVLPLSAPVAGLGVGFDEITILLIGQPDETIGTFEWLDILFEKPLEPDLGAKLAACPGLRTEDWGDGGLRVVFQTTRRGEAYVARGVDCGAEVLPDALASEARFVFSSFADIAVALVRAGTAQKLPNGLPLFFERVAKGQITVAR